MGISQYKDKTFRSIHTKFVINAMILLALIMNVLIVFFNTYVHISNIREAKDFCQRLFDNDGYELIAVDSMSGASFRTIPELPGMRKKRMNEVGGENFRRPDMKDMHGGIFGFRGEDLKKRPRGFKNYCAFRIDAEGKRMEVINYFRNQDFKLKEEYLVTIGFPHRNDSKRNFFYKYQDYLFATKEEKSGNILMIILDYSLERNQQKRFSLVSFFIFISSLLFSYIVTWFIAFIMIKPIHESLEKQKRFIADTSHELKTPIAVIGANIDVLQNEIPGNKWLSYIKAENARMGELVRDMLYLAKNDSGRMTYQMLPFDFVECCKNAALPFESIAAEQKKKFELNFPKEMIPVTGDHSKITQLVIILVDNAIKNSFEGALIRITCGIEEKRPYIKVYNTGRGISAVDMKKIFDRFYRVDSSRDRSTGGYGLGLAIAKTIADAHKGKILVDSKEGEWAEFTFTFKN